MEIRLQEDTQTMLDTIGKIQHHAEYEYQQQLQYTLPHRFKNKKNILVAGMGGSGLCADIIKTLHAKRLNAPLYLLQDYRLPHWVDADTLIVCISYSGNTEEVLSVLEEARAKQYDILTISSGGAMETHAQKYEIPFYKINTEFNQANQPRLSVPALYEILTGTLNHLGYLENYHRENWNTFDTSFVLQDDITQFKNSSFVILAAEHLQGTAHAMCNIINENAKKHAHCYIVPECTHHMIEASSNKQNYDVILLDSKNYLEKNKKRISLIKDILHERNINTRTLLSDLNPENEFRTALLYTYYLSVGIASANNINPMTIPTIEAFKKALTQA